MKRIEYLSVRLASGCEVALSLESYVALTHRDALRGSLAKPIDREAYLRWHDQKARA